MLTSVHRFAALFAFGLIATFMAATLMAEGFLSYAAIADVKQAIVYALFVLVPLLAMTGGSGFALSRRSEHPLVAAKTSAHAGDRAKRHLGPDAARALSKSQSRPRGVRSQLLRRAGARAGRRRRESVADRTEHSRRHAPQGTHINGTSGSRLSDGRSMWPMASVTLWAT